MSRVGTTAVTQIFTSVKNWVNSKLPTKVSDLTNDSGFITEHPSISTSSDTTSTASPSANGTFTCIDSVTRDTNGHVTKVNTKTITLPKDTTYSGMTASEATTGTSTTNKLISPKVLEDKISEKISSLVDSAPSTLDTLNELASALGDDPNFATTVATQIGTKANDNAVVHLSGNETISGTKVFKSDKLISTSGNSYRIINNSNNSSDGYGVFQRIDSGNWYLMLTAKDDALGSWANPRPAVMSLSTGVLNINGNSATATEFSANKSVTLTGDVTGTASSKGGWTVSTTLANSGVSAGTYTNVTVDAKGRVTSGNTRHSYTVTSTSKAWFRLANATSSPLNTDNPPHVQFILIAYNSSLGAGYYEEWWVDAKIFGSQSGLQIFGSSGSPFQYGRILYEATTSSVTNDTKPCIDIYLNNTSQNATNIEIIELYNTGFEFVSGNTLSVSYTPSGFKSRQVGIVQSGVSNSDWANYATRTQINRIDISSDTTLADSNTYRGTCLNCTNNLTINIPSLNSALCWFIIKNVTNDKKVTIHPTTSVTIDGSNNDIVLRPKESITILSRSSNNFIIINDNRRRTAVVGRTVVATGATKHWFLVAETTVSIGYVDIYASFKVFKASGTYQASGILSLHVRVDSTIGVSSNRQLQWEYNNDTSILPLEKFAVTTTETSGDNIKVQLWYKDAGSYASCKFVMLAEQGASDYLDNPIWKLTRFRKSTADGDMETLDTGFTTTTYSSLMSIENPIPALSNYVTLNTAQEITNTKTFKDATTARKLTTVEAGNVIPTSDKLISDIWQDKNGKELGRIYYTKTSGGNTALIMRAGDYFSESEGVYSLNASGTNRRAELHLYSDSSGNCCIKPVGLFSTHIKPLNSSVYLGDSTRPFGRVYANNFQFCNTALLPNTDVQATEEHSIGFFGQSNTPLSYITFQKRPNLKDRVAIRISTTSSSYKSYDFDATCFYPESNNSVDIGSTTNIFKNIYCNNYYKGTTAFGDIVTHNASEFLTSHQSLANYVTTNTDQSISGTKTFGNGTLIVDNGIGSNVHGEIKLNGSRPGYIVADNASDGVFDNAGCGVSILLQDAGKPLHIGGYKVDSNGRVFADNTNKNHVLSITSSLVKTSVLVPENDTVNSTFRILSQLDYANGDTSKVLDVRFIQYDNASGSSAVYSNDDNKTSLGLSSKKWSNVYTTNAYITNLNLNGNAFDPTSIDGIGTTRLLAYEPTSTSDLSNPAGTTKSGSALYDVRMNLENAVGNNGIFDSSSSGTFSVTIDKNRTQPGTWKVLHYISAGVPSASHNSFAIAMWVRIA